MRQRSEQQLRPTRCTMGLSDSENSLKQVVQLCSTLAEKGFSFNISIKSLDLAFALESTKAHNKKRKRRSPSYYKRQAKRRLLKKKPDTTAVPHDSCSLDLDPIPDATFHSSSNPDRIFYPKRFRIGNSIRQGFFRKPRRIGFFIRNGFG